MWIAQTASGLGNTFSIFIMSWLLYDLTSSTTSMGLLWFLFMVATVTSQLFSGPYIDRFPLMNMMIFSELSRGIIFILPAVLYFMDALTPMFIYMTAIIVGLVEPIFRPSSMAYLTTIVPKNLLMKANSLLEGTLQTMMLIGPTLGGVLVSFLSPLFVIVMLIAVLVMSSIILTRLPKSEEKGEENKVKKHNWIKEFKEGITFYKKHTLFMWLGVLIVAINLSAGASQPILLPYVMEHLDGNAFQYGLLTSGVAAGMILGSFVLGLKSEYQNLKTIMLGALLLGAISLVGLGFVTNITLAVIFIAFNGFFIVIFNINNTTLYQKKVPDHIKGRVFSVRMLLSRIGMPIGAMIGGMGVSLLGYQYYFLILGLLPIIPCLIAWFLPAFNQLNEKDFKETDNELNV